MLCSAYLGEAERTPRDYEGIQNSNLSINLKAAKALGLMPATLLAHTEKLIE